MTFDSSVSSRVMKRLEMKRKKRIEKKNELNFVMKGKQIRSVQEKSASGEQ